MDNLDKLSSVIVIGNIFINSINSLTLRGLVYILIIILAPTVPIYAFTHKKNITEIVVKNVHEKNKTKHQKRRILKKAKKKPSNKTI